MASNQQTTPVKFAGKQIRVIAKENPCREGTRAYGMVETIVHAKTVEDAFSTPFKHGRKNFYVGSSDLWWCMQHGIIELKDEPKRTKH